MNPAMVALLKELGVRAGVALGGSLLSRLFGQQQGAYQQMLARQQQLARQYTTEVGNVLAGKPTPATMAIENIIGRQFRGARQAAAASASRLGQAGTSVARARQERFAPLQAEATAGALGQYYADLMRQAGGMQARTFATQGLLAQQEQQAAGNIAAALGEAFLDAELKALLRELLYSKEGGQT